MIGILLISHGKMAEGLYDTVSTFFGDENGKVEKMDYLSLGENMGVEEFGEKLREKLAGLDDGSEILILADLFGGTPCNQALSCLSERVRLISGMNLPMVLQILYERESGIALEEIIDSARNGIVDVYAALKEDEDGDLF